MASDESTRPDDSEPLAPKTITERFDDLEPGDTVSVNERDIKYEVVETNKYSVIARTRDGHQVTFSQNLQSGGWIVTEDVFNVRTETHSE